MVRTGRILDLALLGAAVAAVAIAVASYLRPRRSAPVPDQLVASVDSLVGTQLPAVTVLDGSGSSTKLALGPRPTLFMVFRSTCAACEATASEWKTLAANVRPATNISIISLEGPEVAQNWLNRQGISADTVILPGNVEQFASAWHASAVPLTLLVDRGGTVRYAHLGVLNTGDVGRIEHLASLATGIH